MLYKTKNVCLLFFGKVFSQEFHNNKEQERCDCLTMLTCENEYVHIAPVNMCTTGQYKPIN